MKKIEKIIIGVSGAIAAAVGVSFGMIVYNQHNQPEYGVRAIDIKEFYNNGFYSHMGENCSSSEIRELIQLIQQNNNSPETVATYGAIELVGVTEITKIKNSSYYKVEATKYNDEGLISQITITELP